MPKPLAEDTIKVLDIVSKLSLTERKNAQELHVLTKLPMSTVQKIISNLQRGNYIKKCLTPSRENPQCRYAYYGNNVKKN